MDVGQRDLASVPDYDASRGGLVLHHIPKNPAAGDEVHARDIKVIVNGGAVVAHPARIDSVIPRLGIGRHELHGEMAIVARRGKQRARCTHHLHFHFHLGSSHRAVVDIRHRSKNRDGGVHLENVLRHVGVEHEHVSEASREMHAYYGRYERGDGLAEGRRFGFDSADPPSEYADAVCGRRRAESHRQGAAHEFIPVGALREGEHRGIFAGNLQSDGIIQSIAADKHIHGNAIV